MFGAIKNNQTSGLPERLFALDIARGLAALVVVFCHWQHFFFVNNKFSQNFDRTKQPFYSTFATIYSHGGHVAVLFFFALSGFIFYWLYAGTIKQHKCSLKEFFILRFARLYPLFLASLLLVAFLQLIHYWKTGFTFVYLNNDLYHFVLNLFMASFWGLEQGFSFNGPTWSISIEVVLYVVFFLTTFFGFCGWKSLLTFFLAIAFLERLGLDRRWSIPLECFFAGGLAYYVIKTYLQSKFRSRWVDLSISGAAIVLWGFLLAADHTTLGMIDHHRLYGRVVFPVSIMALVIFETHFSNRLKTLRWIGEISYSSYLIHFPLQIVFVLVILTAGLDRSVFYSPLFMILFFMTLLPLSFAVFQRFERPAQEKIRNRLLGNQQNNLQRHG
jgi:peptidoglycan/LPS O-acetylase OafA/YrhL